MASPEVWREVYQAARREVDPSRKLELCLQCRRLIQDRQTEIADGDEHAAEKKILEEALRNVWTLEQEIRKPRIN